MTLSSQWRDFEKLRHLWGLQLQLALHFLRAERLLRLAFVGLDLSTLVKSLFGRITLWWLTFFMAGSDLKGIAIQATLAPQHVATVPVATKT